MINNLKPPFHAINGEVRDGNGAVILRANQNLGTTPLGPSEIEPLVNSIAELLNKQYPVMKESIEYKDNLNEAQLGDKVALGKERGYIIGQTSDKQWIVQIQGSTKTASDKEVKVLHGLAKNTTVKPHMKFDDKTQKLLEQQFIRCGVFYNNIPIKMTDCYVRYSEFSNATPDTKINVLIEGALNIMPKNQVKIFEDPQNFANPQDYVEAVVINPETGDATQNILVHAGDYSEALGDADPVRVILGPDSDKPEMETLPRKIVRTLAV
jgi:hypothetical protein